MGLYSFTITPLNCLVDGLYAHDISTKETQSTTMGSISSAGYMVAAVGAYLIKDQTVSREGWLQIFRCQTIAGVVMMILLSIFMVLRGSR